MDKIIDILYTISSLKWDFRFYIKLVTDKIFRTAINRNKTLKNIHSAEKCVIVGNGPSLKTMDLSVLASNYVFTVNDIGKNKSLYLSLNSSCHIIVDPFFCNKGNDELRKFLDSIVLPGKTIKCICQATMIGNPILKEYPSIDFYYVYIHNNWRSFLNKKIELHKNLYQCLNVVQAAICTALYMGFKEIYLIGCDMTSMYEHFEINANNTINNYHAYEYTIEENQRLIEFSKIYDNESILHEYYTDFYIFKKIKMYAIKNGTRIFNSTPRGLLDMFDRISLDNIIRKE